MADAGAERWLLYAVTGLGADQGGPQLDAKLCGAFGYPCAVLSTTKLAAVVSRLPAELPLREPKTADLVAYSKVLESVHAQTTVVPLRFGSVLANEAAVRTYLTENTAAYEQLLARLHGTEELAVRVILPPPEAPPQAPSPPPAAPGAGAAYLRARQQHHAQAEQQKAAGDRLANWLRNALMPCAISSQVGLIPQGDRLAVSAAFLIARGTAAALRQRVRELAAAESLKLIVSGPFPPFSFAELPPASVPTGGPAETLDETHDR